jgi:DNA-binding beta-propeller fold protein YncE
LVEEHRFGVCLRDDALNAGKWWLTKLDEDTPVRPWGAALAPDGKRAVVSDAAGNKLFVMEVATGDVRVLAGQRVAGTDDGAGTAARFWSPRGVAFAPDGRTVYVADSENHLIRAVSYPEGVVTTLAGKVRLGVGRKGVRDGSMALGWISWSGTRVAMFSEPHDVAVSPDGLLVAVADFGSNRVRVIRVQDGTVVTLVKRWESPVFGIAMGAQFSNPRAVAFGAGGVSVLVADVYGVRELLLTDLTAETLVHTFDWTDESWYATGLATCSDGTVLVAQT